MKVLAVNLISGAGHYTGHLRAVLAEALERGWETTVAINDVARERSDFDSIRDLLDKAHRVVSVPQVKHKTGLRQVEYVRREIKHLENLRRAFRAACEESGRPDVVYIVECDHWYAAAAALGSPCPGTKFVTVPLAIRCHRSALGLETDQSRFAASLQSMLAARFFKCPDLACALMPDETAVRFWAGKSPEVAGRFRYLPDIAELPPLMHKIDARTAIGVPTDAKVILSYGCVEARKGVLNLVRALADSNCPPDAVAVIAGRADDATEDQLTFQEPAKSLISNRRLFRINGWLDETATRAVFSCADVAWLGYNKFYNSSGFLWQAARAGLPVIACQDGVIGDAVGRHCLGIALQPEDTERVVLAMKTLCEDEEVYCIYSQRCKQEGEKHTPGKFGIAICDAIEGAARLGHYCGLPSVR